MKLTRFLLLPALILVLCFRSAISNDPPDIDHAAVIKSLNKTTLEKGKQIYERSCIACHGAKGSSSYPQARSFSRDVLRFGNKPYDMWRTVSNGAGLMAPQTWLSPAERYYVIQYIREAFMKKSNPGQYFEISDEYLAGLPKSQRSAGQELATTKMEALKGSQKYGQEWFRNHKSNYGTAIHSQLKDHTTAALTVLLDNNVNLSYNLLRMCTTAAWQGELNLATTKYKNYRGEGQPIIQGKEFEGLGLWQWTYGDQIDSLQKSTGKRAPLPEEFLDYHGHYAYNKNVVLSYAITGRDILELPQALKIDGKIILSQTLYVSPGQSEQKIQIGFLPNGKQGNTNGIQAIINPKTNHFIAAGFISSNKEIRCEVDNRKRIVLTIPASSESISVQVLRTAGTDHKDLLSFTDYVKKQRAGNEPPVLQKLTNGGPAQWTKTVKAVGELNANRAHFDPIYREDSDRTAPKKLVPLPIDYPYTIDNIGLPFDNAYNAWIRPTCLGFKSNGSLVIGTYTGDVWIANGIDNTLKNISWQRIAAGLFECMGLKIVNDKIYVTTRNGIVLLHDLNGDGETDFYENFHGDHDVSSFFHAFNFSLETDSQGNFYYAKPGEYTDNKDPGNLIKVSPDGKKWESIATGFRVNNGVTITPDDRIFVSDNQGNWEPANKINLIEKGAYYGYVPNLTGGNEWSPDGRKFTKDEVTDDVISPDIVKVPDSFHQPVIWLPQEFDNSPGGGVWSDKSWGPLGNQFIHTSYGTGWIYYFLTQKVDDITQGAMVALPFQLDAGIQRAAVNPVDKQVYVTGLTGWDDAQALKYGVLSRVRYKGGEGHLIKDAQVVHGGIKLTFNFRLDGTDAKNLSNYAISQWNYKWTSRYGSAHYSIRQPGTEGEDKLPVKEATICDDGKSVLLAIPDIGPAQTVRLRFEVKGEDQVKVKDYVYLTIHKIPQ
ncbi:DUF6797 domain-containing protein [Flavihumibacter profundi]|uniref:DUF6797 domain-containing protein n=1 Tax=Flavihumibacter profundi TaxID=2716883 RepID=UPI001CC666C1|nr:DUF6797 domain-containing protein [Flavihumibacter profundi]MBZ5859358.1 c-type cytochrome [Flavihumibacter profundi]